MAPKLLVALCVILLITMGSMAETTLFLRASTGACKPHHQPSVTNWVQGYYSACTTETPCDDTFTMDVIYTNYAVEASLIPSFTYTVYDSATRTLLLNVTTTPEFLIDPDDKTIYIAKTPQKLIPAGKIVTQPIEFIITFNRLRNESKPNFSSMTVSIRDAKTTVSLVGTSNELYSIEKFTVPAATMIVGADYTPQEGSDETFSPYDNMIELDFDLSWNDFDALAFDTIWIKPTGFAYLYDRKDSYECMLGGSLLTDLDIIHDDQYPGYYYLQISNVDKYTEHNQFNFNTASRMQIQCRFPKHNLNNKKTIFVPEYTGYSLIINVLSDVIKQPAVWFSPTPTVSGMSQLKYYAVPEEAYLFSVGDSPAYSLQSRFVRLLHGNNKLHANYIREYMSYYYLSFPVEFPITYEAKDSLINNPKTFSSFLTAHVQGNEMFLDTSLEYAQWFLTCIHFTPQQNVIRTFVIAFGNFNYETRIIGGPSAPRPNSVSITSPMVHYNADFVLSKSGLDPDGLPQCIQYSFDLSIGTYNSYNAKFDEYKQAEVFETDDTFSNPTTIRLKRVLNNATTSEKEIALRQDWISSFSIDSSDSNPHPTTSHAFQITNVKSRQYGQTGKKGSFKYFTFDFIVDTTGMETDVAPDQYGFTMSFTFQVISGLYAFKMPEANSAGRLDNIQCNIEYTKNGKIVKNTVTSTIIGDRRLAFELVDVEDYGRGIPYDTPNIHISCGDSIGVKKIDHTAPLPADQIYLNIALLLESQQTFVGSVFGRNYDPHHHKGGIGAGTVFLCIFFILLAFTIAGFAANYFTNGLLARFIYTYIPPFNSMLQNTRKTNYQAQSDSLEPSGYGTYQDDIAIN